MFLRSKNPPTLLCPETTARPDGILMLDNEHAMTFAVTIWTGLVPQHKVKSQESSTSMNLAYCTQAGDVNSNCVKQRNEWEAAGLDTVKSVRVHIELPHAAKTKGVRVQGNELLVSLNKSNIHHLVGRDENLRMLLAAATNTDEEGWYTQ